MKRVIPLALTLGLLLNGCGGQEALPKPEASQPQEILDLDPPLTDEFPAIVVQDWETWEWKSYPDVEQFLKDQGFDGVQPVYTYQDQDGRPQLDLYYEDETGAGCGIRHVRRESDVEAFCGFAFETTLLAAEDGEAVFSAARWDRWKADYTALPVWEGGEVEDYQESSQYDAAGRVTSFASSGIFEGYGTEGRLWVYSAQYDYDENGVLRYRHLGQNPQFFGTHESSWDSYFDGQGRLCYERGYLTHGSQEYYYIYANEGAAPAYCLYLDENCGVWRPEFAAYGLLGDVL